MRFKIRIIFFLVFVFFNNLISGVDNISGVNLDYDKDSDRIFFYSNGGQPDEVLYYDYVILGAGSAGSVVASKLADDPNNTVLLVEEGVWDTIFPNIWDTNTNWNLNTNPAIIQTYPNSSNKSMDYMVGKVIGGTNSINSMIVMGGSHENYEDWSNTTENPLLNWENSKSALEDIMVRFDFYRLPQKREFFMEIKDALKTIGYSFNPYPLRNGVHRGSFSDRMYMMKYDYVTNTTKRQTSFGQYVRKDKQLGKKNLDIMTGEKAIKHHFVKGKKNTIRVKGVLLSNIGVKRTRYINIAREIVLSMGAIKTSQWLQLNGIGNRDHLESIGIKSVIDSPGVGVGLKDEILIPYKGRPLSDQYKNNVDLPKRVSYYDGFQVNGPTIGKNFTHSTSSDYILNLDINKNGFICDIQSSSGLGTNDKGFVKIISNDHTKAPEISINIDDSQEKLDIFLDALKECRSLEQYFVDIGILSHTIYGPSIPVDVGNESTTDLIDYIKKEFQFLNYPCCSVKSGAKNNPFAPLDGKFKVKGVSNLRVVDASSLPKPTSGPPNVPIIALATQVSQMILNEND
ncbi:hypothetical protein CYY_003915 [Polysphondylium violaceum]|uniref:Glucose-methanol-choline oxidoreductase N-terminal domain-containing protein n=1 Tax=Polysphondylium violaceum TaxID=133409 RepID=A0A8J4PYZ7_9MYCE|nr:hypothetical protein CYY_003915 [Polysphondylium violaceum]